MHQHRIVTGLLFLFAGIFLNWLSKEPEICKLDAGSSSNLFCDLISLSFVDFGITQLAYGLTAIGFVYLFLFDFVVSIFQEPVRRLSGILADQRSFARKVASSDDLSSEFHKELAIHHARSSTSGKLDGIESFMESLYTSVINPAMAGKKHWKFQFNHSIDISDEIEHPEYFEFTDNTSFFVWCCDEKGTYETPFSADYIVPCEELENFTSKIHIKFHVKRDIYSFQPSVNAIDFQKVRAGETFEIGDGSSISYADGKLTINIDKTFSIRKGMNKIVLFEKNYIHRTDNFFSFDFATPCRGANVTIDLPRKARVIDCVYSHLVLNESDETEHPAISDHRHHFMTDKWILPGLLFALWWSVEEQGLAG